MELTLARALAYALRAWHHYHRGESGADPWEAACRYAAQRAEVLRLARLRSWPVLDTTRPRDVVLAEAVGIVREVLRD